MICYIAGCICYGSENFGLGPLHDDYVGLAGATPQFYNVKLKNNGDKSHDCYRPFAIGKVSNSF